jgi:hypothetical protein
MPRSAIPDPLERRHLIERDLAPAACLKIADAYLAAGRTCDAIAFLSKANATERLAALRDDAVVAGDAFLVRELSRALRSEVPAARWRETAAAAAAAGKERYAAQAAQLAERGEGGRS